MSQHPTGRAPGTPLSASPSASPWRGPARARPGRRLPSAASPALKLFRAVKVLRAGALLLAAPLLLTGCSNNPYPPGETAGPVLYRALGDDPKTLDPSVSYVVTEAAITDLIYPTYFRYHYLKRDPFVLELNLGAVQPRREPYAFTAHEKGRAVRKVGEAWTFHIKRGLRFQDDPCFPGGKGREITAADFLYSFRRMADPSVGCPVLSYFLDKVLGFAQYASLNLQRQQRGQPADFAAPIEGLQLDPHDPYTFRILLNQPYPQLRYLMAMHFTTPIPHEAVERYGKEFARHPVGCGLYMMTAYRPKQEIVLEVNPNHNPEYYPTDGMPGDREAGLLNDAGRPLPFVRKIVFSIVREDVTGWNLFLQGYQDAWGVTQTNFQQVMSRQGELSSEMKRKGIRLVKSTAPNVDYFAFNMQDPVVGGYGPRQRKLRQAISLAIDSQAFIDLFSQGLGSPAAFIIPPGLFGYDPDFRNPYRRYDPKLARAKDLLAEAGYPNGIDPKTGDRLTLYFDNTGTTPAGRQFVGLVTKEVEALGIDLESRAWRPNVWQDKVDHGQFQFIYYGWLADYPDAENFLFLLYGPNRRPGPNTSAYANPTYDRLFERMRAMDDGPARLALIRRMRAIAVEDCPWIFLQHSVSLGLDYDWLSNVKLHPVAMDGAKYLRVDGPRRARLQTAWNRPNYWPAVGLAVFLILGSLPAAATVRRRRRRRVRHGPGEGRAPGPELEAVPVGGGVVAGSEERPKGSR